VATITTAPTTPSSSRFENQLGTRLAHRLAARMERIALMRRYRAKRLVFGSTGGIAGTVYGTIVVMATITAGSQGKQTDAGRFAVVVVVTVFVLWIAHVYAHGSRRASIAAGSPRRRAPPSLGASCPFSRPRLPRSRRSSLRPSAFSRSRRRSGSYSGSGS
jgi:hypothetical protein